MDSPVGGEPSHKIAYDIRTIVLDKEEEMRCLQGAESRQKPGAPPLTEKKKKALLAEALQDKRRAAAKAWESEGITRFVKRQVCKKKRSDSENSAADEPIRKITCDVCTVMLDKDEEKRCIEEAESKQKPGDPPLSEDQKKTLLADALHKKRINVRAKDDALITTLTREAEMATEAARLKKERRMAKRKKPEFTDPNRVIPPPPPPMDQDGKPIPQPPPPPPAIPEKKRRRDAKDPSKICFKTKKKCKTKHEVEKKSIEKKEKALKKM